MKRILSLMLCVLLIAGLWVPASASSVGEEPVTAPDSSEAGQDDSSTDESNQQQPEAGKDDVSGADKDKNDSDDSGTGNNDTPGTSDSVDEGDSTVTLSIENQNAYEGMEKAYKNGYTPTVSGSTAVLVLPLTADGELKNNRLTASLELGDTASSPFVYKNYEKSFSLEKKTVNGSKTTHEIYYVRFDLSLSADRYNGVYPVVINITAQDSAGNAVSQSFTTYVTIKNGKDPNASEEVDIPEPDEPEVETPTSSPIVLVTGYVLNPGTVTAGGEFSVDVTLYNTSNIKSVQNMVVTASCESQDFTLKNDSNTFYISKLGKEDSTILTLTYKTSLNTAEGQYTINLNMSYDDPEAVTLSSSGVISVPVIQAQRVEMTMPQISGSVTAGDTLPLNFQVLNLGRSMVYNVRCEVSGYGLLPTSTAFVGDMEPGTEGNASLNLFIGTKDLSESYTGTEQYGSTTGTITLTYEDAAGEEYTKEYTFETTIEKPVVAAPEVEQTPVKRAGQWWISIAVCGAMLILVAGGAVYFRWKKAHEAV